MGLAARAPIPGHPSGPFACYKGGVEAYVLDAVRTPIGRFGGALALCRPDDLAALVLRALVQRSALPPEVVDDVVLGAANQAGEDNRNVARMALLLAGLPYGVPGVTVNRLCASGLEAVVQGARAIRVGDASCVLAGGVESMSRAPFVLARGDGSIPRKAPELADTTLGWRFTNPRLSELFDLETMGETAENVAERYGIDRASQDAFALSSHQKAVEAQDYGLFSEELIDVEVPLPRGTRGVVVRQDEGPRRDTNLDKLSRLAPVFRPEGTVTAGNASPLSDGAACLLLGNEAMAQRTGRTPLARIVGAAVVGVDPTLMGIGPIPATQKLLDKLGWSNESVELVEINEAFASQAVACQRILGFDPERVNVHGGALALGHPLGCSGARILVTLVHAMRARGARRGVAALCVGVGQGLAVAVEQIHGSVHGVSR